MSRSTGRAGSAVRVLAVLGATAAAALVTLAAPVAASAAGPTPPSDDASTEIDAATELDASTEIDEVDDGLPLEVLVTAVTPQVLQPGQDLSVTVRVRNDGGAVVAEPRVTLSLDRTAFIGRFSLDRWRTAAPTDPVGTDVVVSDLAASLAPGQQATIELVVPAAQARLPSRATSWGARGLAVTVVDRADPARSRLGVARTFALWFPQQDVNATRVSVVAPVVGPAADATSDAWVPTLEAEAARGGRLADVLEATVDAPGVTWLLDPWLLDAADTGGVASRAWRDALLAGTTDREVQLLPYLDADLTALAHAARADLVDVAIRRGEATARVHDLPDAARVTLALPAVDEPDLVTAALAGEAGHLALLVGPGTLPPPAVLTYTPSGRSTVSAGGDDVTLLVPDARLSGALETGRVAVDRSSADVASADAAAEDEAARTDVGTAVGTAAVTTAVTPATAAQDLLAELAVITRERPNDSRHVLLTVPRDWAPDVDVVRAQLAALAAAPWTRLEPVSALIGLADPELDRGTLPARTPLDEEIGGSEITALTDALDLRRQLVGMLTDPASALGDTELELLAPLSVAWRADPAERSALVGRSRASTAALADAVSVSPTTEDGINVLSSSAELPVNVTNALTEAVTVSVRLRADDPRLRAEDAVEVTIPAESQVLVRVPVHAVQSADVEVTVEVLTPDGALVNADTSFLVRVRAEWEGIGTAIIGSLLAVGLVVGIVRTIRRGRTARRAAPEPAAGPDALSPEEDEEEARP